MDEQVTVRNAKADLSRLLVAVERGDEVVIARDGHLVARVEPMVDSTQLSFLARCPTRGGASPG
jgi:antitoxin (DNA-binding transcriptional repressor) of toxin-antitoxin stability system